jgi:hypothetical protein
MNFGPVAAQMEAVIVKFTVKWFKRTSLNLGYYVGLLLKSLHVLGSLHCLNVSSVASDLKVYVSISEDNICPQMLAALPVLQCKHPRMELPQMRPLLAASHCKVELAIK